MEAHALHYSKGYEARTGYTFWEKDFDAMAYKTMLRQLISKWGIMSIELQTAFEQDVIVEGQDYLETEAPTLAPVTDAPQIQEEIEEPASAQEAEPEEKPKRGRRKVVSLDEL